MNPKIPRPIKSALAFIVAVGAICLVALLAGCRSVGAGTDPLVLRCEQTESIAYATFDTFLKIDNLNRGFIQSNAPAVHAFAEKLRQPVMDGTNVTRQGLLWITQLERAKEAYKSSGGSTNAIASALATVENAVASAQQDIVTFGGH